MNVSARKVIGLLSVLALMLVSVSEGKVSSEECAQQIADELVNHPTPYGVKELIAHVNGFFPGLKLNPLQSDSEIEMVGYKSIAHPEQACDEIYEIYGKIADKVGCVKDIVDRDINDDSEDSTSIKPLIEAVRACYINERAQYSDCDTKLDDHLSDYKYDKASKLIDCVRDADFSLLRMKASCQEYVNANACIEVHNKHKEILSNIECASKEILTSSIETSKKGTAANLLIRAMAAC